MESAIGGFTAAPGLQRGNQARIQEEKKLIDLLTIECGQMQKETGKPGPPTFQNAG